MAKKRANGEGSITKRKDGRWQAAITVGYDANGKQKRKTIYGRTQADVRKGLDELKRTLGTTDLTAEDMTLEDFMAKWLDEKARQVKPRTIESYRYTVKRYINPKLGRVQLDKLTPLRIQTVLGHIADVVSPGTSNYCRSILFSALKQAVRWRLLAANPVDSVDRVREEKREMTVWTTEQIEQFLRHAEQHRLYALFYLAITSGLRIGELLALEWADLDGNLLFVRRNLARHDGELIIASTKTTKGRRVVTLAEDTLEVLAAHRRQQDEEREFLGEAWERPNHMFTTQIGTYLDHRNVTRVWHRLQDEAGVPRARFHDARHLHVSLLVRHGLDARTIADRVGHTNPAFTLRQYSHLFEEQRLAAAVPLAKLLNGKRDEPQGGDSHDVAESP